MTKCHTLGSLNSRKLFFSQSSGGWKSEIKVLAGLGSSRGFLPDLQKVAFSLVLTC
jgi:hypothetical protein